MRDAVRQQEAGGSVFFCRTAEAIIFFSNPKKNIDMICIIVYNYTGLRDNV